MIPQGQQIPQTVERALLAFHLGTNGQKLSEFPITPEHFTQPEYRRIADRLCGLHNAGEPITDASMGLDEKTREYFHAHTPYDERDAASYTRQLEHARNEALRAAQPWVPGNVPLIGELSPKPVTWLIEDFQSKSGLGLFASKQGGQKSLTALALGGAIADGTSFLGRKVQSACPVLYVDRENPEAVVSERARKLGIRSKNLRYWGDWHPERTPEPDDVRLIEFASNGGFIIFDSLQDWYGDANENDNSAMVQLMNKFKHLARIGAGVMLLHHQDKFGKASYRGCSSIVGLTDMAFASQKNDAGVIQLREERFRMCGGWEIDYRFHFGDAFSVEVLRDESVSDAIANQQADAENARVAKRKQQVEAVACAIRNNPKASIPVIADAAHVSRNRGTVVELAKEAGFTRDSKNTWVESGALLVPVS